TFLQALEDCDLTPQADPNTASQIQRAMKLQALKQLQTAQPSLYDPIKIDTACIQALGFSDPSQFFAPPQAQAVPPPQLLALQAKGQADTMSAQAKMTTAQAHQTVAQAKADEVKAKAAQASAGANKQVDTPVDMANAKARLMDAHTKRMQAHQQRADIALQDANAQEDRQSKEKLQLLEMARELVTHPQGAPIAGPIIKDVEGK